MTHDWVYVVGSDADAIVVVDISAPTNPVELHPITSTDLQKPQVIEISGDYAPGFSSVVVCWVCRRIWFFGIA